MNAYSSDLREWVIVAARDANLTQREIAKTFSITLSSVEDWLRTYRTTGASNRDRLPGVPNARCKRRHK